MSTYRPLLLLALFVALLCGIEATHFRYCTYTWEKVLTHPTAGEYRVTTRIDLGGRLGYSPFLVGPPSGAPAQPGSTINWGTLVTRATSDPASTTTVTIRFGNQNAAPGTFTATTSLTLNTPVSTVNTVIDALYSSLTWDNIVTTAQNPFTLVFASGDRLSTLLEGNANTLWREAVTINLDPSFGTKGPQSTSLPIIYVTQGVLNQILIPTVAYDNYQNRFTFASSAMSSLSGTNIPGTTFSTPMALDATVHGRVNWTPSTAVAARGQYAVQFTVTSWDTSVTPNVAKNAVPLDLIFIVQQAVVGAPSVSLTTPQTTVFFPVATTTSYVLTAATVPFTAGYTVAISSTPRPPSGVSSFNQGSGCSSQCQVGTVSWNPTASSSSHVMCFQATATQGSNVLTSPGTLCVNMLLGAFATRMEAFPARGVCGGPTAVKARLTRQIDGTPIVQRTVTFSWADTKEILCSAQTDTAGNATCNFFPPQPFTGRAYNANFTAVVNEFLFSSASSSTAINVGASATIDAPIVTPLASVGVPLSLTVKVNRVFTDGGLVAPAGTAVNCRCTPGLINTGGFDTANGVVSGTGGIATVTFSGSPSTAGTVYNLFCRFEGDTCLAGNVQSTTIQTTVVQRVILSLSAPSPVACNEPFALSGTLLNYPQLTSTGVARNIALSWTASAGGAPVLASVTTVAGTGAFSATGLAFTQSIVGGGATGSVTATYTLVAGQANDAGLNAVETVTDTFVINQAATAFSIFSGVPASQRNNNPLTPSITLTRTTATSGPIASASVLWTLTRTSPAPVTVIVSNQASTTSAAGVATTTFTAANLATSGQYSIQATYAGTTCLAAPTAAVTTMVATDLPLTEVLFTSITSTCSATVTFTATVRRQADGTGVSGAVITFARQSGTTICTATANSAGTGSCTSSFASVFTETVTASWPGQTGVLALAATQATLTINIGTSTMSAPTYSPTTSLVGGASVLASATLGRVDGVAVAAGNTVIFTVTYPGGSQIQPVVNTVAGGGVSTTISGFTLHGLYTVRADFAGTACQTAVTGPSSTFAVYQRTTISMSAVTSPCGLSTAVSATLLTAPGGTAISGQTITFNFGASGVTTTTGTTNAAGVATVNVAFLTPGTFTLTASFLNTAGYYADSDGNLVAESTTATANIATTATTLSAITGLTVDSLGDTLTFTSTMTRSSGGAAIAGNNIIFTITLPGGGTTTVSDATDASGVASVVYTPTVKGAYSVTASWTANTCFLGSSSGAKAFTIYQNTRLVVTSLSTSCGAPVNAVATLTNVPSNTPLSGQSVTFSFDNGLTGGSATTDASGVATFATNFPNALTYTITASFSNAAAFFADENGVVQAETGTGTATVTTAVTTLTTPSTASTQVIGGAMTVTSTLARSTAPAGGLGARSVTFTISGPGTFTPIAATTDVNGLASATFPAWTVKGSYTVTASFAATGCLLASSSVATTVTVYQRTLLTLAAVTSTCGSAVTISATLTNHPAATALSGQAVNFAFGGVISAVNGVTTNAAGVASTSVTFPVTTAVTITASFSNAAAFFADENGVVQAEVATTSTTPSAVVTSFNTLTVVSVTTIGSTLAVSAQLVRTTAPTGNLAGVSVVLSYSGPATASQSVTTDANGLASFTFPALTVKGAYTVAANFAPTGCFLAASRTATTNVYQRTRLVVTNITPACGANANVLATLTIQPANTALSGQTVTFSFDNGLTGGSATTDASGVATFATNFPSALTYTITASFSNAGAFFADDDGVVQAEVATGTATVGTAATALTAPSTTAVQMIGAAMTVTSTLTRTTLPSGVLAGRSVTFTISGPGTFTPIVATTDAAGVATANFPAWTAKGSYTVTSSFAAGACLLGTTSTATTVTVYQRTLLTLAAVTSTCGNAVTISATLTNHPAATALSGQAVNFAFGGVISAVTGVTTNAAGVASTSVTFPVTTAVTITASFSNAAAFFADENGVVQAEVATTSTTPSAVVTTFNTLTVLSVTSIGSTLAVSAQLQRTTAPAGNLAGANVVLSYSGPATASQSVATDASGIASFTFPALTVKGAYTVAANFAATGCFLAASRTATTNVYQRTRLVVNNITPACGASATAVATLTNQPSGTVLSGQSVTFSFDNGVTGGTVTTDASGVASFPVTFPNALTYTITASFSNAGAFFADENGVVQAETATGTATVAVANTALTVPSTPTTQTIAGVMTVSSTLTRTTAPTGALQGRSVTFSVTGPGTFTPIVATTDTNGLASATFPAWTVKGSYTVTATFAAGTCLAASSNSVTVNVYQRARLTLSSPVTSTCGNSVTISATLTNQPSGTALAGQAVNFAFGGVISAVTGVNTDAAGVASTSVTFPVTTAVTITASFSNAAAFFADDGGVVQAETDSVSTTPAAVVTTFSTLTVAAASIGNTLAISATLQRTTAPAGNLAGFSVVLSYTGPATGSQAVNTDGTGLAAFTFPPLTAKGVYTITATFGATGCFLATTRQTTVTIYQRTALAMSSVTGTCGQATTVSATLTNLPSNSALAGQTVTFTFGGGVSSLSATTAANGVATVNPIWTSPTGSPFTVTASFSNPAAFFSDNNNAVQPTVVSAQATIGAVVTALSAITGTTGNQLVGDSAGTVSVTLTRTTAPTGALSGRSVVFTLTGPTGGNVRTQTGTTDASGVASVSFGTWVPADRGSYTLVASAAGDGCLNTATSATVSFGVYQRAQLSIAAVNTVCGDTYSISATLTTSPGNVAISGKTVSFSFDGGVAVTATTNAAGVATLSGRTTTATGVIAVAGSYEDVANFYVPLSGQFVAVTTTSTVTVTSAGSALAALSTPATAVVGNTITVTTTLTRTTNPTGGIVGGSVSFTVTGPAGSGSLSGAATSTTGGAVSFTFSPPIKGAYSISASYAGNTCQGTASASAVSVSVYQRVRLSVLNTPYSVTCSQSVTVTARALNFPALTAISSEVITLTFTAANGATAATTATPTTNTNGDASASVTIPTFTAWSPVTIGASFAQANFYTSEASPLPPTATSASGSITISAATASLTAPAVGNAIVDIAKTYTTTLSTGTGATALRSGVTVTFVLFNEATPATIEDTETAITAADGTASVSMITTTRGEHKVTVSIVAGSCLAAASTTSATFLSFQRAVLEVNPATYNSVCSSSTGPTLQTTFKTLAGVTISGVQVMYDYSVSWTSGYIDATGTTPSAVVVVQSGFATPAAGPLAVKAKIAGAHAVTNRYVNLAGVVGADITDTSIGSNGATAGAATLTITQAPTTVVLQSPPTTGLVGSPLTFTALLRRTTPLTVLPGQTIRFQLTLPGGSTSSLSATTDANGLATVQFPNLASFGTYSITAFFETPVNTNPAPLRSCVAPSTSGATSIVVKSNTAASLAAVQGVCGAALEFVTTVTASPGGELVADALSVTVTVSSGHSCSANLGTGGTGVARCTINFPAALTGSITATATVTGNGNYHGVTSPPAVVVVNSAATNLAPLTALSVDYVGNTLLVSTTLTRSASPSGPIGSATVSFTITGPTGGSSTVQTISGTTNAAGFVQISVPLSTRGDFDIVASYVGTTCLAPTSRAADLTVLQRTFILANAAHGVCTDPTTVTAGLYVSPDTQPSTPISGQTVSFDFANVVTSGTATTNNFGIASISRVFNTPGQYTVTVSFQNLADFFRDSNGNALPSTAQGSIEIVPIVTQLAQPTIATQIVGDDVHAVTVLSRVTAPTALLGGRVLSFSLDGGAPLTATTNSNGEAQVTFTIASRGTHTVSISFAGDLCLVSASTSAGFSALQTTQLTVSQPTSGVCGVATPLRGVLVFQPGAIPAPSQTVTFTSASATFPDGDSATTNAAGVATVLALYQSSGTFSFQGSFAGGAFFVNRHEVAAPETDSSTALIIKANSALSAVTSVNPTAYVSATQTLRVTLTRTTAPAGPFDETVRFTIVAPSGATTVLTTVSLKINGLATVTFVPSERGLYRVTASFNGNSCLNGATSAELTIPVYQRIKVVGVQLTEEPICGAITRFLGQLQAFPDNGEAPALGHIRFNGGSAFDVTLPVNENSEALLDVVIASAGDVSVVVTFIPPTPGPNYLADSNGVIEVGDVDTTSLATVSVSTAETALSDPAFTTPSFVGDNFVMTATLTRTTEPAGGVAGVNVIFTITFPDGSTTTRVAMTSSVGLATATFTPQARGLHQVQASFTGTTCLLPSGTNTRSWYALQRAEITLSAASVTCGDQLTFTALITTVGGASAPQPVLNASPTARFSNGAVVVDQRSLADQGNGVYRVTLSFAEAATLTVTVTWDGQAVYYVPIGNSGVGVITASNNVVVNKAATAFDPLNYPSSALVGAAVTLSTVLRRTVAPTGTVSGGSVSFDVQHGHSDVVATGSQGAVSLTFVPVNRGNHAITVSFAGDSCLLPASLDTVTLPILQQVTLNLINQPYTTICQNSVTATAELIAVPANTAVIGESIHFVVNADNGDVVVSGSDVTTGNNGRASLTFAYPYASLLTVTSSFTNAFFVWHPTPPPVQDTAVATATVTVTSSQAVLSAPAIEYAYTGVAATFTTVLSSATATVGAGQTITFRLYNTADMNTVEAEATGLVGRDGASADLTATTRGVHVVVVSMAAQPCLTAATATSEPFNVYTKVQVTAAAVTVAPCGAVSTFSAHVAAVPQPQPAIAVGSIRFDFGTAAASQTVAVNANGDTSVTVTLPAATSVAVTATFVPPPLPSYFADRNGVRDAGDVDATSLSAVSVPAAVTSLTVPVPNVAFGVVQQTITLTSTLTRTTAPSAPISGASVTFSVTTPSGPVDTVVGTTAADGTVSVQYQLLQKGLYQFAAAYAGDACGTIANSGLAPNFYSFQRTALSISPATVPCAADLSYTATLTTVPQGAALPQQTLQFTFTGANNQVLANPSGITDSNGKVTVTVNFAAANPAVAVSVSFVNTADFYANTAGDQAATVATSAIDVTPAATEFDAVIAPGTGTVGAPITITTRLRRTTAPAGGAGGETVTVNVDGPISYTGTTTTAANGDVSYTFTPMAKGVYQLSVAFAQGVCLLASDRAGSAQTVYQRVRLTIPNSPFTVTCANSVSLSALLVALPGEAPVSSENVAFRVVAADGTEVTTATSTTVNGLAPLTVTPANYVGWSPLAVSATFNGVSLFYTTEDGVTQPAAAATASASIVVESSQASLSVPTVATTLVGLSSTYTTTLSSSTAPASLAAGVIVTFTLYNSNGDVEATRNSVTGTTGVASAALTPTSRGLHTVGVSVATASCLTSASAVSASFAVHQRVKVLAVHNGDATIICGAPTQFSASVTELPQDSPLVGVGSVTFSFTGLKAPAPVTVPVGAGGLVTTTVVFEAAGAITVTARFVVPTLPSYFADSAGVLDQGDVDSTSLSALTALNAQGALTPPLVAAGAGHALIGETVSFVSILTRFSAPSGPIADKIVHYTITAPSLAVVSQAITTLADGSAPSSFVATERGVYSLVASYAGDDCVLPQTSTASLVTLYQRTSLAVAAASIPCAADLVFTATLTTLPANDVVSDLDVTCTFSDSNNNELQEHTATTDEQGVATFNLNFPLAYGAVAAHCAFSSAATFYTDSTGAFPAVPTTANTVITVGPAQTELAALSAPVHSTVDAVLTVSTSLTRLTAPSAGAVGETVLFTVTGPAGSTDHSGTSVTGTDGIVSYSFTPTMRGVYKIIASFPQGGCLLASSSNEVSVPVFQRSQLTIATASIACADQLTYSSSLKTVPGGVGIGGKTVRYVFSSSSSVVLADLTATTAVDGSSSVQPTFAAADATVSVRVSFNDAADFYADSTGAFPVVDTAATSTVAVQVATVSLSTITAPATSLVGAPLTVSVVLTRDTQPSGPAPGETVAFAVVDPSGTALAFPGSTTDANGVATLTFTPALRGTFKISASFAGGACLQPDTAAEVSTHVYQRTSLAAQQGAEVNCDQQLTYTAVLRVQPQDQPLANAQVFFVFRSSGDGSVLAQPMATTDATGTATVQLTFADADAAIAVHTSFIDAAGYYTDSTGAFPVVATTDSATVKSKFSATSLSAPVVPTFALLRNSVTISTTLTRTADPAGPAAGETVHFTVDGQERGSSVTDSTGVATFTFFPANRGPTTVSAEFKGTLCLIPSTSGASIFPVYERTRLTLAPATVACGDSLEYSASLRTVPDDAGLASQTVSFVFVTASGTQLALASGTTNGNGVARVTVSFTDHNPAVEVHASFADPVNYYTNSAGAFPAATTTASSTIDVTTADTALAPLSFPATGLVSNAITVSTVLTRTTTPAGFAAGQTVTFTVTDPSGATTTFSGTTAANGAVSHTFTPAARGTFKVSAAFAGGSCLVQSSAPEVSIAVYQRTSLHVQQGAEVNCAQQLTYTALLHIQPQDLPLVGSAVVFTFTSSQGATLTTLTATTDATGTATVHPTFADADAAIVVHASFVDAAGFYADSTGAFPVVATVASTTITSHSSDTSLSALIVPTFALLPNTITVSTTLTRLAAPSGPAAGETVFFTVDSVELGSSTTNAAGVATFVFTPTARGVRTISAAFKAGTCLNPSHTADATVPVLERTELVLATASVACADELTYSASLRTVPAGMGVSGKSVVFVFHTTSGTLLTQATGTTNGNGIASVTVTFPNSHGVNVQATFSDAANFYTDSTGAFPAVPTVGSSTVDSTTADTSLSALSGPTTGLVANAITVSTVLTRLTSPPGGAPGELVAFTVTDPNGGTTTYSGSQTTGSTGAVSYSFTPASRGTYKVSAYFAAGSCLEDSSTAEISIDVYQRTSLSVPANVDINCAEQLSFSAVLLAQPQGTPVAAEAVAFQFTSSSGQVLADLTSNTNSAGSATVLPTFAVADSAVAVRARFINAANFFTESTGTVPPVATLAHGSINVHNSDTSLSALVVPTFALLPNTVTVSTTLTRTVSPSGPAAGETVFFTVNGIEIGSSITNAAGLATYVYTPTVRGTLTISAAFKAGPCLSASHTATATVPVLQRTELVLTPASIPCGGLLSYSATLRTLPDHAAVRSKSVHFVFATSTTQLAAVTGTTDSNGVATVSVSVADAAAVSVGASFSDASDFYTDSTGAFPAVPTTGSSSVTVGTADTSLSAISVSPLGGLVGVSFSARTVLTRTTNPQGPAAGETVTFTLTDPAGTVTTHDLVTGNDGSVTLTFTPFALGDYRVSAAFAGGSCLVSSSAAQVSFRVYQRTALSIAHASVACGAQLSYSATLTTSPAPGAPLGGQSVEFRIVTPDGVLLQVAVTNAQGVATITPTFDYAYSSVAVTATFSNTFYTNSAGALPSQPTVASSTITSTAAATELAPLVTPATNLVGQAVTVTTTLTRTTGPSGPAAGEVVYFAVTGPAGSADYSGSSVSQADGSVSFTFNPANRGTYHVSAAFVAGRCLSGSTALAVSFDRFQRVRLTIPGSPFSVNCANDVTVAVRLVAIPGEAAIAGQEISLQATAANGDAALGTTLANTAVSGDATVTFNVERFVNWSPLTLDASFSGSYFTNEAGAIPSVTATATGSVIVSSSQAVLTLPLILPGLVDLAFVFPVSLTSPTAPLSLGSRQSVTVTLINVARPSIIEDRVTYQTHNDATVLVTLTPSTRGIHRVSVDYEGNHCLTSATVHSNDFFVYQRTAATVDVDPPICGAPTIITTTVTTQPGGQPIENAPVHVDYPGSGEHDPLVNCNGEAQISGVIFPNSGPVPVTVTYNGTSDYYTDANGTIPPAVTTTTVTVQVGSASSSMSALSSSVPVVTPGHSFSASTTLTRTTDPVGPVANAAIVFTLSATGSTTPLATVTATTASNGRATAVFAGEAVTAATSYTVSARFNGDGCLEPGSVANLVLPVHQ